MGFGWMGVFDFCFSAWLLFHFFLLAEWPGVLVTSESSSLVGYLLGVFVACVASGVLGANLVFEVYSTSMVLWAWSP